MVKNSNSSVDFMLPLKRATGGDIRLPFTTSSADKKLKSAATSGSGDIAMGGGGSVELKGNGEIDEDLHSRQLAVYGRETMRRLFASNVLVSGMQGLGAEIAKNLVLAGVKSVTLHDVGNVELWDLSSNFVFSEEDIGKNRAVASLQKLQELNNAVTISTLTNELTKEQLSDFQAVVFTDISLDNAIDFDDYCHKHQPPIAFIKCEELLLPSAMIILLLWLVLMMRDWNFKTETLFCFLKFLRLQKKLGDANAFVVGSGALGCEFLKNLALMGVCCGDGGKLTITDDDVIEKSNLSRQFLFRDWNIGQAKSTVAASAASLINPRLRIEALQNRANPEKTPSGIRDLGPATPDVNHLNRENYGASRDPPENKSGADSLFYNIDHCLTWARPNLRLFSIPAEVNAYLNNPSEYISSMTKAGDAQARDTLERVLHCLDNERCKTFQDCITWARLRFEDYFANRVKQLTYTFPEDAVTSSGAPFWSAPKRFPRPLQFSVDDPSYIHYAMAASILRAETFGIPIPDWAKSPKSLAEGVDKVIVPDFQPRKDVKIETDEKATSLSNASIDDSAVINDLIRKLEMCREKLPPGYKMNPIQFEKDDDTNYHMDLIASLANMRARNYSIPEVDKLKAKFIAGRIIPAIATSTAMATGLVCLELYKVLNGGHKLEDYRNTFANLALPLFSIAEPVPAKVIKHQDMSWTVWDRWILKDNPTLRELLQWLQNKGLNPYSISYGSCLIYNTMFPRHKDRMDRKLVDLVRDVAKAELPPYRCHFDVVVACEDDEDNDIDIPQISVYFRGGHGSDWGGLGSLVGFAVLLHSLSLPGLRNLFRFLSYLKGVNV
ncbi:hypothetical protein Leryth_004149 [Lithospermum erythrorhizon]|nr:hypothetical protein Leryth_004149 [Lithospermum erythrorhizon]